MSKRFKQPDLASFFNVPGKQKPKSGEDTGKKPDPALSNSKPDSKQKSSRKGKGFFDSDSDDEVVEVPIKKKYEQTTSTSKSSLQTSKDTAKKKNEMKPKEKPGSTVPVSSQLASGKAPIPTSSKSQGASPGAKKKDDPSRKTAKATPAKANDKPPQTPEEKKRSQNANYFKYISRGGPKNLGSKTVPVGAPNCFDKMTFVLTGVLDSFERGDIEAIVSKYGGRVTSAVSGKTSYLLVGDEPGESKIAKAKTLKIPTISEDEFLELIRKSNPNQPSETVPEFLGEWEDEDEDESKLFETAVKKTEKAIPVPVSTTPKRSKRSRAESEDRDANLRPAKAPKNEISSPVKQSPPSVKSKQTELPTPSKTLSTASSSSASSGITSSHDMWVDKYKPKLLKNVVGQMGDKSNAQKLFKWLTNWFDLHGSSAKEKRPTNYFGNRDPEGKTFKAVLLSGPPGIGKTTTAHLCCKEIGYDYFELNASDTRNKRGLHDMLSDSLTSEALTGFKEKSRRHILIMDEVDGMSGNEDRGGIQELIGLIKSSRVPVICICNDRMHPKIRSLSNYCFDLRFNKPTNEQLKAMIQSLCFKEKMKLPMESVQQLINSTDQDIRQILHQLQLIKEASISGDALYNPHKDLRFGPWDVVRKVFSEHDHRSMSFQDKSSLFFQDYNIGSLFVHENYLKFQPTKAIGNKNLHLDKIKSAAASIATGDLVESIIRRSNNWSLLPTQAVFSSVLPGEYMEGNETSGINFPAWLGQNSHKGKTTRLLQQLYSHVHLEVSGSSEALNMDYLPYLHKFIVKPLIQEKTAVSVELMHDYSLLREDLDSITEIALWPGVRNPMESVSVKVKTAFTKAVNREQVVPYSMVKIAKKRGGAQGGTEGNYEEEGEDEEEAEEEEDDRLEKDAMIKVRSASKKSEKSSSAKDTDSAGNSRQSSSKSGKGPSSSGSRSKSSKKK